jgi:hypothetical protein
MVFGHIETNTSVFNIFDRKLTNTNPIYHQTVA